MNDWLSWILIPGLWCCVTVLLHGQAEQVPLDRDYRFREGFYSSFQELQVNQPSAPLSIAELPMVHLADDYRLQIEHTSENINDLQRAYAIVLDGIPYLKTRYDSARAFSEFSGLRIRGRLCYLTFDTTHIYEQEFQAYNPYNQRPFLRSVEVRSERQRVARILDFSSGQWYPFDRATVAQLVAEDRELVRALETISPEDEEEKLYRCLLIYDDRHPFYMPPPDLAGE